MGFGAILGGAAQGLGQGTGRFSNALMTVMGSQQQRQQRTEDNAYRRQRDAVHDAARAEAVDLQERTLAARERSDMRNFEQRLREGGFEDVTPPSNVTASTAPMASEGVGSSIARQFRYNPDLDPTVQSRIAVEEGLAERRPPMAPEVPTFTTGGAKFPMTEAGYAAAGTHTERMGDVTGRSGGDSRLGELLAGVGTQPGMADTASREKEPGFGGLMRRLLPGGASGYVEGEQPAMASDVDGRISEGQRLGRVLAPPTEAPPVDDEFAQELQSDLATGRTAEEILQEIEQYAPNRLEEARRLLAGQ